MHSPTGSAAIGPGWTAILVSGLVLVAGAATLYFGSIGPSEYVAGVACVIALLAVAWAHHSRRATWARLEVLRGAMLALAEGDTSVVLDPSGLADIADLAEVLNRLGERVGSTAHRVSGR